MTSSTAMKLFWTASIFYAIVIPSVTLQESTTVPIECEPSTSTLAGVKTTLSILSTTLSKKLTTLLPTTIKPVTTKITTASPDAATTKLPTTTPVAVTTKLPTIASVGRKRRAAQCPPSKNAVPSFTSYVPVLVIATVTGVLGKNSIF